MCERRQKADWHSLVAAAAVVVVLLLLPKVGKHNSIRLTGGFAGWQTAEPSSRRANDQPTDRPTTDRGTVAVKTHKRHYYDDDDDDDDDDDNDNDDDGGAGGGGGCCWQQQRHATAQRNSTVETGKKLWSQCFCSGRE